MFCMCIDNGCVVTGESKIYSVFVLTEGVFFTLESKLCFVCLLTAGLFLQGREIYILYLYTQRVPCYRGKEVMFCMSIVIGCVGSIGEIFCALCVLTESVLLQGRLFCVLYLY